MLCFIVYFLRYLVAWINVFFVNKNKAVYRKPVTKKQPTLFYKNRKKPEWISKEIIQLKAHCPQASCRVIAYIFNQRFQFKKQSVSKTFVNYTIRNRYYEIQVLRKQIKNRPAYPTRFNHYWGVDITFVNNQPVLGVTEHHSRKLMGLIPLSNKSSLNLIKQLSRLFLLRDKPKLIRTDNERCFNSKLMKLFLMIINVKHQAIDKHCPWQNGRIERLFGTFKHHIQSLTIPPSELPLLCYDFQQWYNTIRPHQSLEGETPEAVYWQQVRRYDLRRH